MRLATDVWSPCQQLMLYTGFLETTNNHGQCSAHGISSGHVQRVESSRGIQLHAAYDWNISAKEHGGQNKHMGVLCGLSA